MSRQVFPRRGTPVRRRSLRKRRTVCIVSFALIGFGLALPAEAGKRVLTAKGVPQTGLNDSCGAPIWSLPGLAPGPATHGTFLAIFDPAVGATDPLPLQPSDCAGEGDPNAALATTTAPGFFALRGWPDPNPALRNLTLRRVGVPAGNGMRAPIPLPGSVPPNPFPPTIAEPTSLITVGTWLAADGKLKIVCNDDDGTATLKITLRKLVPHGVYTVWGAWLDAVPALLVAPIGGLPNVIVPDGRGKAKYQRELAFCPLDLAPDSSELMFVSVVYHADGVTYGAVPAEPFDTRAFLGFPPLPFLSTIPSGIVSFDHVGFEVGAQQLP